MLPFIIAAFAIILIALFINAVYDPGPGEKHIFKAVLNFDNIFFNRDRDAIAIKKGNRLVAVLCSALAVLTVINGFLTTRIQFPDLTEKFIIAALVVAFPVRYIYIFRRINNKEK